MSSHGHNRNPATIFLFILIIIILNGYGCTNNQPELFKTIMIPVRDGTQLATDLYFPDSKPSPFPTVLLRTPYNKKLLKAYGDYYSSHGYITAIQDVRGKYDSKGDWKPYEFEGRDGYDTIEWLANQEFSDGKIGMVGGSYSGSVQLAAAINAPPHLVTIIPNITPATPFNNTPYENGVFALGWGIRWSNIVYEDITGQEMNERFREVFQKNWYEELENLPVIDLDEMITGEKIDFWRAWINNPPVRNSYYHDQNYLANLHRINIPVFLQSGWFDVANRGTKLIYKNLIDSGNKNVKLIIGPWVHSDKSSKQLGSLYLGEKAGINLFDIYVKWFDYWLKGIDNGITNDPLVQIFNIGPNNWIYDDEYPIASAQETALYLMSGSNNNSSGIQGKLIVENSGSSPGFTTFRYDPSNPTPGISDYLKKNILSEYQYIIEKRDDVIIFETDPLTYPLTIMGSISAELYASSSAIDTDFSVTLTAVNGKGNIFPIGQTFGVIRAKHRNSINKAELLEKLNVYKYTIDLSHTCYTIAPGEKLRLEISSCSFPEFARNLNTGKNNQTTKDFIVAEQKIYHNKEYPSRIVFYTK